MGSLNEVTRRRIAAALLVVGAVVVALAIADVGPFDDPPTVEQEVEAAVVEFFAAASEGDAKRWCELLTEDARAALQVQLATLTEQDEPLPCKHGFELLRSTFEGSTWSVRLVSVSGNRARVEARVRLAGKGAQPRTIEMLREGTAWRVSDPG